jgi:hypothetical protein
MPLIQLLWHLLQLSVLLPYILLIIAYIIDDPELEGEAHPFTPFIIAASALTICVLIGGM